MYPEWSAGNIGAAGAVVVGVVVTGVVVGVVSQVQAASIDAEVNNTTVSKHNIDFFTNFANLLIPYLVSLLLKTNQ